MPRSKPHLTPLELQIMKVLWEIGPSSVQAVQEQLPGERLAYTTVQTMLNILQRKGKVARKLQGKAYQYRPVLSRERALRDAVGDMLNRMFSIIPILGLITGFGLTLLFNILLWLTILLWLWLMLMALLRPNYRLPFFGMGLPTILRK